MLCSACTGWVGTHAEFTGLVLADSARSEQAAGAPNAWCWLAPRRMLLQRLRSLTRWQGYTASMEAPRSGLCKKRLIVSACGRGGQFVGNDLCRINDGRCIRVTDRDAFSRHMANADAALAKPLA